MDKGAAKTLGETSHIDRVKSPEQRMCNKDENKKNFIISTILSECFEGLVQLPDKVFFLRW